MARPLNLTSAQPDLHDESSQKALSSIRWGNMFHIYKIAQLFHFSSIIGFIQTQLPLLQTSTEQEPGNRRKCFENFPCSFEIPVITYMEVFLWWYFLHQFLVAMLRIKITIAFNKICLRQFNYVQLSNSPSLKHPNL